jgi:hypothetical protein
MYVLARYHRVARKHVAKNQSKIRGKWQKIRAG